MCPARSFRLPCYRRLPRTELDLVAQIQLDPGRIDRYLGPIGDVIAATRNGPAHAMVAIEAGTECIGFYVVHPDRRDRSCWWLGWLAIDLRHEGHGYGAAAVAAAIAGLQRLAGCSRVRLLVAPDNGRAIGLYRRACFRAVGLFKATGELILELAFGSMVGAGDLDGFNLAAVAARARRVFRHRRLRLLAGPHSAWVIGVERGPPAGLLA